MPSKFIQIINNLIGDKPTVEKTPSTDTEVVKESLPNEKTSKETISFEKISSFFSFKKNTGETINTQTKVVSTTTTKTTKPDNSIQTEPEHYTVMTTPSGLQYEEKQHLLKATNINLSYGDKIILRDVNLNIRDVVRPGVQQGQVVSIIGQSGMGKSQLFKILSGLYQIPKTKSEKVFGRELSGEVLIGRELKEVKAGDVGVITQDYLMFNHRTIRGNLKLAVSKNHALNQTEKEDLIKMYVDKFNITDHLDKYPLQLSGGQRQRAAIIQQLLCGGDFILFDEPFSGLDNKMIKKTLAVLRSVSMETEDRTLIIVSHDIATSCSISDHVFILGAEEGKPGATIKKTINMMERDLAWKDENMIRKNSTFIQTIEEIENCI